MPACPAFDPLGPYATGLTRFVDCHARALGEEGWRALGTGSAAGLTITGLLVIFVGLVGYRLAFGHMLTLREAVLAMVKIGFVIALSSQWPAYQVLVYNLVIEGPSDLAGRILAPGGLGGEAPDLIARVQTAQDRLETLSGPKPPAGAATSLVAAPTGPGVAQGPGLLPAPDRGNKNDDSAENSLSRAGGVLLVSTLAATLSFRIIAGIMLALGPIFVACVLFAGWRGLLEGWVRALAGTMLGTLATGATIALELAILEPQIAAFAAAAARPDAAEAGPMPGQLLVTTWLFALVLLAAVLAAARVAAGFRIPDAVAVALRRVTEASGRRESSDLQTAPAPAGGTSAADERPRAVALADAINAQLLREQTADGTPQATRARPAATADAVQTSSGPVIIERLGQSHRRTAGSRRAASMQRRDAAG